jgi:hypothetical protein
VDICALPERLDAHALDHVDEGLVLVLAQRDIALDHAFDRGRHFGGRERGADDPAEGGPLTGPVAGVPAGEREELLNTVAALPQQVSVLLIEHDMDLVFEFADRITVLVNGVVLTEGTPQEIAQDERVKAVYLGHSEVLRHG